MKSLVIATSLLLSVNFANATSRAERETARQNCAFGETTGDLVEHLELATGAEGKIWYQGEHLSLSKKVRLGGLSATERKMIALAVNSDGKISEKEMLEDFSSSDGYLTYFGHNSLDRHFVMVASYPGDNEFGAILEIKRLKRGEEYTVLNVAAVISDGDLEDCKVTKQEVKE